MKWNDHHNLFFVGAEELCEAEEYTDVILAAGEKFFPAHKLVLSICSPYFRSLFKRLGRDKAVIFLKDVDPRHLDLLLQYMYKGEIKVQVRIGPLDSYVFEMIRPIELSFTFEKLFHKLTYYKFKKYLYCFIVVPGG